MASSKSRLLLLPLRTLFACRLTVAYVRVVIRWLASSREHTNFTYPISNRSERHLAYLTSRLTGQSVEAVENIQHELINDKELCNAIEQASDSSPRRGSIDSVPLYGRRIAWYALVRLTKPKVVVETGVDKGLGTLVLAAALRRNASEGYPGVVLGIDINPSAGHLITSEYTDFIKLMCGDSVQILSALDQVVDLFIHDSNHEYSHETAELSAVFPKLAANGILLSDAAADSDALDDFCRRTGLNFDYAAEQVKDHWMVAQGVGAGCRSRK